MNKELDSQDDYDENVPDASELLDFELIAKSHPEKGHGLWLWVVLVLVLAGGGWAGWMYMQDQEAEELAAQGGAPMILAPKFPLKEKPSDPGGMKVPDRDKVVYDRMAGDDGAATATKVERLLPPPEAPIEPPKAAPQVLEPKAEMPAPAKTPEPPAPPKAVEPAPEPAPASKPVAKVEPKVEAKPEPASEPKPVAKVEPKPAATAAATGTPGQGYMVQLSAVRNEANAKSEWDRLSKKHADLLGGLQMVIQRADLGAKGVFYRVRGGWFADRAEAKAVCDALGKRNVGCLIAKP